MSDTNQTLDLTDDNAHDLYDNATRPCTEFRVFCYSGGDIKVHIDGFHPADYWHVIREGQGEKFRYNAIKKVQVKRVTAATITVDYGPTDFTR